MPHVTTITADTARVSRVRSPSLLVIRIVATVAWTLESKPDAVEVSTRVDPRAGQGVRPLRRKLDSVPPVRLTGDRLGEGFSPRGACRRCAGRPGPPGAFPPTRSPAARPRPLATAPRAGEERPDSTACRSARGRAQTARRAGRPRARGGRPAGGAAAGGGSW